MRRVAVTLVLSGMLLGLSGCGQELGMNSLSFGRGGEVTHQIIGKTDQDYYQIDKGELEDFAALRVEEYCALNGEEKVSLEAVKEKDGSLILNFKYASPEDYSGFNNRTLYVGTLAEAADAGYEMEAVPLVSPKGEAAEAGDIEEWDKIGLVVLETRSGEEMLVSLPGKILYVNQSAGSGQELTFEGKKRVKISNQEEEGVFALCYIIYEK